MLHVLYRASQFQTNIPLFIRHAKSFHHSTPEFGIGAGDVNSVLDVTWSHLNSMNGSLTSIGDLWQFGFKGQGAFMLL